MLFKGTTTRPGSRIDQEVQQAGGYMNAYTSFDRTVYHINVPNTGATVAIDILCDIMQNASLPAEELDKELDVIRREMDMNQDDPGRRAGRRLFEAAYTKSPYRFTIIGYPEIFNNSSRRTSAPTTANVRAQQHVLRRDRRREGRRGRRRKFARHSPRPRPGPLAPMVLPARTAPNRAARSHRGSRHQLGFFHFAWHIPDIRHPDMPALDILAVAAGQRAQFAVCFAKCARRRVWSPPPTPGLTAPATRDCSA